ncbi:MAG: hypothetical protein QOF53_3703 [Nocardioidaceae bacterium]|nr:hypothetical protein [Nocardioidaceae bacterium]
MLLLAIVAVAGFLLVRMQMGHVRRVADERRSILDSVRGVLEDSELAQRGIDYPVLTGTYRGAPVTVAVIADTLALRQLPTLWLSVTRRQPLPLAGPVDILLRPSSTDIVSPGERFPVQHPVPPDWPQHIRVATPLGGTPNLGGLSAALPLLHDPRTKDLLVTPTGARLVTRLARAELGQYRIVKRAKFVVNLTAGELTALLDDVCAMTAGIERAATDPHGVPTAGGGA